MFRSTVSRGLRYRAVPLSRCCRGSLRRYASSSASSNTSKNPAAVGLGVLATAGSIFLISPFKLKSILPEKVEAPKSEQAEQPAEPEQAAEQAAEPEQAAEQAAEPEQPVEPEQPSEPEQPVQPEQPGETEQPAPSDSEEKSESEKGEKQAAYNPDTGEINWDCPCLGGMAHGPCGEEFKSAFSCFVYSEAEPKGIDCIEKFQQMQDCFRQHPEHYAEQLKDEEEAVAAQETVEADTATTNVAEKPQPAQEQPKNDKPKSSESSD